MAAHLNGRRVLITREAEKAKALADAVVARGGIPVIFPTIEIAPPKDPKPLHDAVKNLALYDWVAVSSKNGVAALKAALAVTGVHITGAHIDGPRFLAVGEGTAQALEEIGVDNPIFPARQDADGMLALMLTLLTDQDSSHKRALVIRAEVGRCLDRWPSRCRRAGGFCGRLHDQFCKPKPGSHFNAAGPKSA